MHELLVLAKGVEPGVAAGPLSDVTRSINFLGGLSVVSTNLGKVEVSRLGA